MSPDIGAELSAVSRAATPAIHGQRDGRSGGLQRRDLEHGLHRDGDSGDGWHDRAARGFATNQNGAIWQDVSGAVPVEPFLAGGDVSVIQ